MQIFEGNRLSVLPNEFGWKCGLFVELRYGRELLVGPPCTC